MSQKVLDILLQKNDTRIPWGFSLCSGPDGAILIDKVWPGALASQYLKPGDCLLSMDGIDCCKMSIMEASQIASSPSTTLNLLVAKVTDNMLHHHFSAGSSDSSPTAAPLMNHSTNRSTPVINVRSTPGDNSQETWRRRCRQSTSPSSSARRAKAAFWERCTSPQRQRLPNDNLPEFRYSRSASSGRSTPSRYCSDADLGSCAMSEPDVDRRRLSIDWDSNISVVSDSGRGTSYGRQQSCPSWMSTQSNSNDSLNTTQHSHNSQNRESYHFSASSGLKDHHGNHQEPPTHHSRSGAVDSQLKANAKENAKWISSQETNSIHAASQSKTQEEEDLKWFSSQEIRYGYVDSDARTHFEEDLKWPLTQRKRLGCIDGQSKTQQEKVQTELNKQWQKSSDELYSSKNSPSKSCLHHDLKQFSSLPKNFDPHFSTSFDLSGTKRESSDKRVLSDVSSNNLENYSSQTCTQKEKHESQQSYHRESRSHQSYNRSTSSTSKKYLESEFEKSFEQFAKMMQTGEESNLLKQAENGVMNEMESKQFSEQLAENFKETERRFESYVKDLNVTDNANIEKKFEKTVLKKTEEVSVTRSHTPAGFYDNHNETSTEEHKGKMEENDASKTSAAAPVEVQSTVLEKKPRPASECLDRQGLYDAFNRLRSSSPCHVNETLQTDTQAMADSRRQQSQISGGGNSPSATAYHDSAVPPAPPPPPPMSQGGAPPPPPPPPPLGLVHIPNMRLKTEISDVRREPPAAIQNAMMTKDKKPFTYTPGGLDLSEIRSPRMQRRINRNAQAEDAAATTNGVDRPAGQPRPLSMPPGSGAMPQMAVPVFPQAVVGSGHAPHPPPPPLPPAPPQQQWSPQSAPSPQQMAVPKMQPVQRQVTASPVQNTGSIYVPPVQTQPQPPRSQLGSLYVPPVANNRPAQQESTSYSPSPVPYSPPTPQLNKSPAPWMSRNNQAQQQAKDQVPPWVVNRETAVQSPSSPIASAPTFNSNNSYGQQQTQSQPQTRIIPIQIEGHETPQSNTRIVPIQMEGSPSPQHNAPQFNYQQQQPQQQQLQQRRPVYVHNKNNSQFVNPNNNSTVDGRSPQGWVSQSDDTASSTPVQSRSFRVLQKITDANNPGEDMPYNSQGVPLSQLRKLQLSDDDRALMNKVKTQVDEEQFLHNESDPRYRGASIPSRAFRMLQNMTEHPGDYMAQVPQGSGSTHVLTNRRPQPQEPTPPPPQPYIPPSEQQVQEPRKYQGGAIPSRSFRILQAMTASSNRPGSEMRENWSEQINNVEGEHTSYPYPYPYYSNDDANNYYANNGYYYDLNQPPQTPEEQQQFWEHYNAMCAYMAEMNAAAYRYSPFPHAYPPPITPVPPPPHPLSTHYFSDSDGYSSTDEMTYYGAYFQRRPPPAPLPNYRMFRGRSATPTPAPRIVITPTEHSSNKSDTDGECNKCEVKANTEEKTNSTEMDNSSSGSDTEVDDDDDNDDNTRLTGLKTIRSVPDINIYKDSTGSDISSSIPRSDSGSVKEEDDEDDNDDDDDEVEEEAQDEEHFDDDSSLHQLSVIYEESEHSSLSSKAGRRDSVITLASEEDASSATLDNCDDTDSDDVDAIADSDTVTVRLPLKLKFSKASDDRDMATVIVGKSEVQPTNEGGQRQSPDKKAQESIVADERKAENMVFERTEQNDRIIVEKEHLQEVIVKEEELDAIAIEEKEPEATMLIEKKEPEGMIVEEITKDNFDADVSVTISLKKLKPKPKIEPEKTIIVEEKLVCETSKDPLERGSSPVDFWRTLNSEDESVSGNEVTARGSISSATEEDETRPEESDGHWEDDSSSTSVQTVRTSDATFKPGASGSDIDDSDDNFNSSCTKEQVSTFVLNDESKVEEEEDKSDIENENSANEEEEEESSESSDSTTDSDSESVDGDEEDEVEEREIWNKNNHIMKQAEKSCENINHLRVDKPTRANFNHKPDSEIRKDEEQNDESEEEEDDSGVTSDMSRHISETDTDPECNVSTRKMNSYQRAATHSRLFKLLQEECGQEDEEGNEVPKAPDELPMSRKDKLTLTLNEQLQSRERDSLSSSSGVDSPSSPNNFDQLANELVQSLLKRKKGRHFRKLPLAKLHDAAVRILKEDAERCDAVSSPSDESNIYSPVDRVHILTNRNSGSFSDAYYGDNYLDYCNYYSTWGYPNYGLDSINDSLGTDIVPSKTFKMLQEHTTAGQVNSHLIEGLSAKCPRILSSKNVPADLQRCRTPEPTSCDTASFQTPTGSRVTTPSTET